jgi:hypothetical protein
VFNRSRCLIDLTTDELVLSNSKAAIRFNTKYEKHRTFSCSGKYLMKARAGIETPLMPAF